jgi:hypothetical protein
MCLVWLAPCLSVCVCVCVYFCVRVFYFFFYRDHIDSQQQLYFVSRCLEWAPAKDRTTVLDSANKLFFFKNLLALFKKEKTILSRKQTFIHRIDINRKRYHWTFFSRFFAYIRRANVWHTLGRSIAGPCSYSHYFLFLYCLFLWSWASHFDGDATSSSLRAFFIQHPVTL